MPAIWIPSPSLPQPPQGAIGVTAGATVARAISALPAAQRRADSGRAHDATSLAYRAWLHGQARQIRADAIPGDRRMSDAEAREAFVAEWRPRIPAARMRADASRYYALDLVDRGTTPVRQPLLSIDLLGAIPMSTVDISKTSWTVKTLKERASVGVRAEGSTTVQLATSSVDESDIYPMHVFHTGYVSRGDWRQRQIAESLSYSPEAVEAEACEYELNRFLSQEWLVSGGAGLTSYHLGNLPCKRATSALTYGTSPFDDVTANLKSYLQSMRQSWKGSRGAGVTLRAVMSGRILDALARYSNWAAGGSGLVTREYIAGIFSAEGYAVTTCHELEDRAGANVDSMILFADGLPNDAGLTHKVSLRPAPVDTYTIGRQDITEMAAISGGLSLVDRDSCLLVDIPVVPALGA